MKLFLNSITYHDCPVEVREKVAFTAEQQRTMLRKMHVEDGIEEAVILDTCNRIEFYVYAAKTFDVGGFLARLIAGIRPGALHVWQDYSRQAEGMDVVRHLFEVAAGLDSQMLGENQILSQVKSAYTFSLDCHMSKFLFHRLFHNAFRVGKAVRADTRINCGAVSVSLAAVELAKRTIDLPRTTGMVVGAGENAEIAARYLLKAGLLDVIIANRNPENAKAMRSRLKGGRVIALEDVPSNLADVGLLISSTGASEPVVTCAAVEDVLAGRDRRLLIIDVAVPRDIDPDIARFECVSLYNIDDLDRQMSRNRLRRSDEIPKARAIVAEFTDKFAKWYDSLDLVPVIRQLTQKGLDVARGEARRYAGDFGNGGAEKLELFAESLVKKVLHGPISLLKNAGDRHPGSEQHEAAEWINKMFLSQGDTD